MDTLQYTSDVGAKFYADGSIRMFPGNTIISFVDAKGHARVYQDALWAQDVLRGMGCAHKMAFLPPDSFHMTVMDLVCDQVRQPERWSRLLPLSTPLADVDAFFIERVATVEPPAALRMRFVRMRQRGIVFALEPADDETAAALTEYRERIAAATGVRFPDHDSYGFHISLAYNLIVLGPEEKEELAATFERIDRRLSRTFGLFEPLPPQLVFFDDMFEFVSEQERHTLASRK